MTSDFCGKCGAGIPPREGEGTCKEGCIPHVPQSKWLAMAEKNTILRMVVGSQAYGLSSVEEPCDVQSHMSRVCEKGTTACIIKHRGSDRDEKGVCVEPLEAHLGFNQFDGLEYRTATERTGVKDSKSEAGDLDLVIYPLKKFLRLALKGNPTIIEMLFIKDNCLIRNALGAKLQELAPYLVSKQAGKAFLGYMIAQKMRLTGERGGKDVNRPELVEKYGWDVKYGMHMLRLGYQGVELLETGRLVLPIEKDTRTILRAVREGSLSLPEVLKLAEGLEGRLRYSLGTTSLPEYPDQVYIEDWMIRTYWEWWKAQRILYDTSPPIGGFH